MSRGRSRSSEYEYRGRGNSREGVKGVWAFHILANN